MTAHPHNRVERAIVLLCEVILWISTTVIFLILVINTVLRYAAGSSLQWANEVPELLFPWLVMSGVVLGSVHGAHITTSFLMDAVPARVRHIVGALGWLAVAGLYGTLASFRMLEVVHDEKSPILHVPGSMTYGCVMGGMALMAVLALQAAWGQWQVCRHGSGQGAEAVRDDKPTVTSPHW
jgi:TRAP-type C4-dicarboxylate transport system permease small subunit